MNGISDEVPGVEGTTGGCRAQLVKLADPALVTAVLHVRGESGSISPMRRPNSWLDEIPESGDGSTQES